MSKKSNARTASASILWRVHEQKGSLASEFAKLTSHLDEQEQRFAQELCYGACRWYFLLENQLQHYLQKPLKKKDGDIHWLIILGMYQLSFTRVAPHAAINETVNGTLFFRKVWAKKLVNGVLRSYQRALQEQPDHLHTLESCQQSHPLWLQQIIEREWPYQANSIFLANNQHPPLTLRVNQQHTQTDEYLKRLEVDAQKTPYSPVGITLAEAQDVKALPGFHDGDISVQDEAAQLSAELLQLAPDQRVLDACCAPGGKMCHIGEREPKLSSLVAIDIEERRLVRVKENLQRLNVHAQVVCGDASQPSQWWDGKLFDRILLDAPCSATGVIRRQPDIKLLRTTQTVDELLMLQQNLLSALWPLLAEGGILVYATCSILPQENTRQIEQFLKDHPDAVDDPISAEWGEAQPFGRQLLPQSGGHDGFYYARLKKHKPAI